MQLLVQKLTDSLFMIFLSLEAFMNNHNIHSGYIKRLHFNIIVY